tara:strand:+ start:268 stop:405 length:138 start_codon:yes stop_codon:yes gene_type:complete
MKKLLKVLNSIDNDFKEGIYTIKERLDLIRALNKVLRDQYFIEQL